MQSLDLAALLQGLAVGGPDALALPPAIPPPPGDLGVGGLAHARGGRGCRDALRRRAVGGPVRGARRMG